MIPGKLLNGHLYELSKKDIAKVVDEFAFGDLISFTGIKNGSVNTHYLIETKRGRYFAKIDEVKSEIEVKQELDLLISSPKAKFSVPPTAKEQKRQISSRIPRKVPHA